MSKECKIIKDLKKSIKETGHISPCGLEKQLIKDIKKLNNE